MMVPIKLPPGYNHQASNSNLLHPWSQEMDALPDRCGTWLLLILYIFFITIEMKLYFMIDESW